MSDHPVTRATLLDKLRDPGNREAWQRFAKIYQPLIYDFCRHQGLQDADASDVSQDVLQAVSGQMARFRYDPEKGKFRNWLFTVVHHKLIDAQRKQQERGSGSTTVHEMLEELPSHEDEDGEWRRRLQQRLLEWASDQVRVEFEPPTWQAFWKTAVENGSGKAVAEELGMSVGAVYVAKSRVSKRLREKVAEIGDEEVDFLDEAGDE